MWSWFGGQSAQKRKEAPKEAILGLRGQLEMLQKRQTHLETQIADQESIARKNVTSNKNGACFQKMDNALWWCEWTNWHFLTVAKAALRRKKMHEKNLEQTQNQIIQLEQHVYSIEAANINQETLSAMDQAGKAMQRMHDGLTMDKVDNMMYVFFYKKKLLNIVKTNTPQGTNYGNSNNLPTKSQASSKTTISASSPTRTNWKQTWKNSSRKPWMRKCSRQAPCPSPISSTGYLPLRMARVSLLLSPHIKNKFILF
jgi:hypothetical protein